MTVRNKPQDDDDSQKIPKWAFDALLWLGGTIWGLLVIMLGYAYIQIDGRLNRIEGILLHHPSSVLIEHSDNPISLQENYYDRVRLTTTREKTASPN